MGHTTTKEKHPLLVCNWPHSVGQNHFFVMMLLNRIPLFRVLPEDSAQFTSQKIWFPASRPDEVIYRPDAQLYKASSVQTTRTFSPDLPLCREASNCSSLYPFGHFSSTFRQHSGSTSYGISFQNTVMERSLQPSERRGFPFGHAHP
jgi:hypothetical protein